MKENIIKKLSDREHILLKSGMYIGGKSDASKELYVLENDKFILKETSYTPGLLKIIDEIIDNSVDEAIRTNFAFANKIEITVNKTEVSIKDNGRGLPLSLGHDNLPQAVIAFTEARAGSNFSDDTKANGIGTNGVGSYLTNVFSKKFTVKTADSKQELTLISINNAESYTYKIKESSHQGTTVTFEPDLEKFDVTEINDEYISIISNRLRHLAQSFPEITFKINGNTIKSLQFKKYLEMFSDNFEMIQGDNYTIAVTTNEYDDFKCFTYVNGLDIKSGGTHIDLITNEVVNYLREKISRKYKGIKPGDIKNKLRVIAIFRDFPNLQFDSQTKERVTNANKDIKDYLGDIDLEKFCLKVYKNSSIVDPITEIYRIKEEFKKRQELKGLEKTTKKIKSDKYLPPVKTKKYLMIVEGESALGGLVPVLGRQEFGYYTLKGKPLNVWSKDQSKFTANKELSELYKIILNEDYEYIVTATDQDLDGLHIRTLLAGFVHKYLPEYTSKFCMLQTPVIMIKKNGKIDRWYYDADAKISLKSGEVSKWLKGLGSWTEKDLKYVIEQDGIQDMIINIDFDDIELLDDWLSDSKQEVRKEYINANDFSITML